MAGNLQQNYVIDVGSKNSNNLITVLSSILLKFPPIYARFCPSPGVTVKGCLDESKYGDTVHSVKSLTHGAILYVIAVVSKCLVNRVCER